MRKRSKNDYGIGHFFTLLELLIIIAIIAILMSMLLPSLQRAKEISQKMVCLNNQKQTAIAASSYMADFNGELIRYTSQEGDLSWATKLYYTGYIKKMDCVLCPYSFPYKYALLSSGSPHTSSQYYTYGMLTYAGVYTSDFIGSGTYSRLLSNKVRYPSSYPLFADTAYTEKQWLGFSFYASYPGYIRLAHGDQANVVFLDGHAESCKESRIRDFAVKTNSEVTYGSTMAIWIYNKNYVAQQINL